ncbi:SDR family NAD(P)-dependent oxidoreductase [Roseibium sediminicola]|uniref:SDR family NAD(P)-dependent oxidoreductase n=1 Tax=Roseibium sediminicola TaxID=2933272 RepID=A0ABT0GWF7_9HYPH|nr:SDR family NAD(P)-dependent oxidoreductase [Roseibium sp. CAU 1639]
MTDRKTIVITGGAIGLGRELTRIYCERGDRVVICGRTQSALDDVRELHPEAIPVCADLGDPTGRKRFVDALHELDGPIDLMIHNAAVQFGHDFGAGIVLPEKIETEVVVNLLTPIALTADLLPLLKQAHSARVVFISSALSRVPKQSAPVYCATKAGLSNFARGLRYQLEGTGIAVTDVVPDLILTRMAAGRGDKTLSAAEAAVRIVAGLDRGADDIRLGRVGKLFALHRIWPSMAYRMLKAS